MKLLTASDVYLSEADELLSKGDVVQASEKYYKAAEEALKLIAVKLNMTDILEKVKSRGDWDIEDLFEIVMKLKAYDEKIDSYWDCAIALNTVHLEGDPLLDCVERVRKLVGLSDKIANS
ncbi:PaREP1 family protein [Sulfolobus tengchongensis]|uniref:PaREP1 family protein n=1 Tax=Sulfolobus tengchongensis TaxID=207809 RepID=A0AAX4L2P5_9CREN